MRTFRFCLFFWLVFFCSVCSICRAQGLVRRKMNFDADWKFHFGNASNPEKDFNYSVRPIFAKSGGAVRTAIDPRFDDNNWRELTLPHDWAVELPFVHVHDSNVESHGFKPVGGLFP
ncbi:MAG TPA: hypothetical protein VGM89_07035, partial [Puia sp.]